MAEKERTEGERQFERYLESMRYSYEFEKPYPERAKTADYTIATATGDVLADAKDFDWYMPLGFMQVDVHSRIRKKIEAGRKKFREYKDFPCCVVLQNNGNVHVFSEEPHVVLGSMYGDFGFEVPVFVGSGPHPANRPEPLPVFQGNACLTATKNRTISALISLRQISVGMRRLTNIWREFPNLELDDSIAVAKERFPNFDKDEERVGVIVWENCFARLPVSREIFNGPYDERWGLADGHIEQVFRGDKLLD
jgi:hypothetical protein